MRVRIPVWVVWALGGIPLLVLIWDLWNGLGPDPVRMVEHRLGRTAVYFLILGLAVTPLRPWVNLMPYRRAIGLIAFGYAMLHVLAWGWLDMGLRWSQMAGDLVKRSYLIFGAAGFVMLIPLAVTSNNLSIRRMRQNWRRLHRLVYPAILLVMLHWLWVLKVWESWPLLLLGLILALLGMRFVRFGR